MQRLTDRDPLDHGPRYVILWVVGAQLWRGGLLRLPHCEPPDRITDEMLERIAAGLRRV